MLNVNQYQIRLILPMMVALALILILSMVLYFMALQTHDIIGNSQLFKFRQALPFMLVLLFIAVAILAIWSYRITNKILGPFNRIIRELDAMLENQKGWRPLKARDGDEMFEQLLRRINTLIDRMPRA